MTPAPLSPLQARPRGELEAVCTGEAICLLHDVAPAMVGPAITELAKGGDIVRCNAVYNSGILTRCIDPHTAYLILPIKSAVEEGELVKFLVDDWMMLLRGYEAPRVNAALREIADPDIARELLALGANPNVLKGAKVTPVGAAIYSGHVEALREMLISLQRNDQAPMVSQDRSLFDLAVDPAYATSRIRAAVDAANTFITGIDPPLSFRRAAGEALHRAASGQPRPQHPYSFQNAIAMLAYATLPATNYWAPVLSAGETINVAGWLLKKAGAAPAAAILRNLVENNFDLDTPLSYCGINSMSSRPLLHAAVSADKAGLVKLLMGLGADPWSTANIDGIEASAFALARAAGAVNSEAVMRAAHASNKVVALTARDDAPHLQTLKRSLRAR